MKTKVQQSKIVKLELPAPLYQRAALAAQAVNCELSEMIVATLATNLPALSEELPPALAQELASWALLDDAALQALARALLPTPQQRRFTALLRKAEAGKLTAGESNEWAALQQEYLRISRNKAKAHYLLAQRTQALQLAGATA